MEVLKWKTSISELLATYQNASITTTAAIARWIKFTSAVPAAKNPAPAARAFRIKFNLFKAEERTKNFVRSVSFYKFALLFNRLLRIAEPTAYGKPFEYRSHRIVCIQSVAQIGLRGVFAELFHKRQIPQRMRNAADSN